MLKKISKIVFYFILFSFICMIFFIYMNYQKQKNFNNGIDFIYSKIEENSYNNFVDYFLFIKNNIYIFEKELKYYGYSNISIDKVFDCLRIDLNKNESMYFFEGGSIKLTCLIQNDEFENDDKLTLTIYPYFGDSNDLKYGYTKAIRKVSATIEYSDVRKAITEEYKIADYIVDISITDGMKSANTGFLERYLGEDLIYKKYYQCLLAESTLEFLYDRYNLEQKANK